MTETTTNPAAKRPLKMAREPKTKDAEGFQSTAALPAKAPSKSSLVIDMLTRPEGATLDQMIEATGWLPHTTRSALTGLKKKGHTIKSDKPGDGQRIYRISASAEAPAGTNL